jgi:GTPase SAR1 family protein
MPARGKKGEKKNKVEEAKLVVFGTGGVGKSGMLDLFENIVEEE